MVSVRYIYHSGFCVETPESIVVVDFWRDREDASMAGLLASTTKRVFVLASHVHPDHFNPDVLFWQARSGSICYVLSADIRRKNKVLRDDERIVWLHRGESFADGDVEIKAFGSTDVGVSFLIESNGVRVFHAGDFGDWQHPDRLDFDNDNRQMHNYFMSELGNMEGQVSGCDLALFPVDYHLLSAMNVGPVEFCKAIRPRYFFPMHCWEQYATSNSIRGDIESTGSNFIENTGQYSVIEL